GHLEEITNLRTGLKKRIQEYYNHCGGRGPRRDFRPIWEIINRQLPQVPSRIPVPPPVVPPRIAPPPNIGIRPAPLAPAASFPGFLIIPPYLLEPFTLPPGQSPWS